MPALVPELIDMASNPNVSTGDLLRRALVAATRLNVPDLEEWITAELHGYKGMPLPEYRKINGQPQVFNPFHGYEPLDLPTPKLAEVLSKVTIQQSIPDLERMAQSDPVVRFKYAPEHEQALMNSIQTHSGIPMRLQPSIAVSAAQIHEIVGQVRNEILYWALDLGKRGILGEGMSFTPQEKQTVQEQHYHFGDVSGSQIQISSNGSTQTQANPTGINEDGSSYISNALPSYCTAYSGNASTDIKPPRYVGIPERGGFWADFEDAALVFYDQGRIETYDGREDYSEDRWATIGLVAWSVLYVVYTVREEETIRIISARKAVPHEQRQYREANP